MKRWQELSQAEQERALDQIKVSILEAITEGAITFDENSALAEAIDGAIAQAEQMQTPWFAHEYIAEALEPSGIIDIMAADLAADSLYAEPNETVLHGIVENRNEVKSDNN